MSENYTHESEKKISYSNTDNFIYIKSEDVNVNTIFSRATFAPFKNSSKFDMWILCIWYVDIYLNLINYDCIIIKKISCCSSFVQFIFCWNIVTYFNNIRCLPVNTFFHVEIERGFYMPSNRIINQMAIFYLKISDTILQTNFNPGS